jgi:hypothetical protein
MATSRNKTQPTKVDVESYIARIPDEARRRDCGLLVDLMRKATGCAPKMWGPSIVGFDEYHYRYESGREGDSSVVGFSSGSAHLSLYLLEGFDSDEAKALLSRLGKHKTAKVCLYIKRLADVDLTVLERLVVLSVEGTRLRYPKAQS